MPTVPGLTTAARLTTEYGGVSPVTGDPLYEVAIDGPTGDYTWGFFLDEGDARQEVSRLNRMFEATNKQTEGK